MESIIQKRINEHIEAIGKLPEFKETIKKMVEIIINCYKHNGKVILFGNGGSCADSMHLATEFVSRYYLNRKSLPAIALTDNVSLTALGNDYSFEDVFAKQVEGFVNKGDVVIGISTSGSSKNVIKAIEKAKELGGITVAFTGKSGGMLRDKVDICLNIPSDDTPRIQEGYMLAGHIICELVEKELFEK
ncbi:D-sedoheptulose 7-phosphate isomerase [Candidatus Woesearchaeota archaeon]|nr:D-sedoheptulose 7-phosphate isomerase [Candidatus Woesearchaeota archaeon]